jgi:hypothetical protein
LKYSGSGQHHAWPFARSLVWFGVGTAEHAASSRAAQQQTKPSYRTSDLGISMNLSAERVATDVVKDILRALVTRPIGESVDDRELAIELEIVQRAVADYLRREGFAPERIAGLRYELLDVARKAYIDLWLTHAHEDETELIDEQAEIARAMEEFKSMTRFASRL